MDTTSACITVYAFYETFNHCWDNQLRIAGVYLKILVNDFVEENDRVDANINKGIEYLLYSGVRV